MSTSELCGHALEQELVVCMPTDRVVAILVEVPWMRREPFLEAVEVLGFKACDPRLPDNFSENILAGFSIVMMHVQEKCMLVQFTPQSL